MDGINLNSLRIFLEVSSSKSFLEAANKLYISQPAVSRSMSKLEEDLGMILFERTNNGISLTPIGEVLYQYVKEIHNQLQSCERVLNSMNDIESGDIIIGVQSHIVRNYLMDRISTFRSNHPNIKIKLIDMSTKSLLEELEAKKVDFVIDSSPIISIYNNIIIEPIVSLSTKFIKSKNNHNKIKTLEDLKKEKLILPAERSSLRKNLKMCLETEDDILMPILEFETEELVIDSVRRNLGIGYVVEEAVKYLVEANIIEYVDLNEKLPKMEINLVYIKNNLSKIAKLFIEEVIKKNV